MLELLCKRNRIRIPQDAAQHPGAAFAECPIRVAGLMLVLDIVCTTRHPDGVTLRASSSEQQLSSNAAIGR
ncbi:MAG TPA: hypothetical protein DCE49_01355, partial [Pseudomonas sp.]|nr:hypothetical protein [Pseudomonas sp.]